jgi:hypothetical protein
MKFFSGPLLCPGHGIFVHTGDLELTEGAAHRVRYHNGTFDIPFMRFEQGTEPLVHLFRYDHPVFSAFDLVMPFGGDGLSGTALLAFTAFPFDIIEAVGIGFITPSGSNGQGGIGHHRGNPDITAGFGDQSLV